MLFLPNNLTQACQLASAFLVDLPRICEGKVVVPLQFGVESAAEDVAIFTTVAHVAR